MSEEFSLRTPFCQLTGIDAPVVQTGMGFVAGAGLAAATSAAGGLGIIGGATMRFEELERAIARVQERTDRPFGVNLRSDQDDVEARAALLVERGVRVASFALAPSERLIKRLKDAGIVCVPSVGARRHAEKVADWGVDAVIVQGGEGGGHTGPVPTTLLLPQVVDSVDIPVIAAGGFFDGRGLAAALCYGAQGIAMGTRFLLTQESPVPDQIKRRYLEAGPGDTIVTSRVDGLSHRMLRTALVEGIEQRGLAAQVIWAARNATNFRRLSGDSWSALIREGISLRRRHGYDLMQVLMAANAPMLCRAAMVEGREDVGILSSGQVAGVISDLPTCAELIQRILIEARAVLGRVGNPEASVNVG